MDDAGGHVTDPAPPAPPYALNEVHTTKKIKASIRSSSPLL